MKTWRLLIAAVVASLIWVAPAVAAPNYQTAAYTLASTDDDKLVVLGGNAQYALTIGAPSTYSDGFHAEVINQDPARGKTIVGVGSNFILYPLNRLQVDVLQGVIYVTPLVQRNVTAAGVTLHVNPDYGNDANDGLSGGCTTVPDCYAFQHIQTAVNLCEKFVDFGCSIQLDDSQDYSEAVNITRLAFGNTAIYITGDLANPSAVYVTAPSGQNVFSVQDGAIAIIQGIESSAFGGGSVLNARQGSIADLGTMIFGQAIGGSQVSASSGGRINFIGNAVILNSAGSFAYASGIGSSVTFGSGIALTINEPYPITFSAAFVEASDGAEVVGGATIMTGSTVIGCDALASVGGQVRKNGSVFPGPSGDNNSGGYITP